MAEITDIARMHMEEIVREATLLGREIRALAGTMMEKRVRWEAIAAEYTDLEKVYQRYATDDDPPAPQLTSISENRPGPTEWVTTHMDDMSGANATVTRETLIAQLTRAIQQELVASSTSNAAKLASTLVSNMIKRGKLKQGQDGSLKYVEGVVIAPRSRAEMDAAHAAAVGKSLSNIGRMAAGSTGGEGP